MNRLRTLLATALLAVAAVWGPATWVALADQDRMRLFQGWIAEGLLQVAAERGVQAAADARMRWARYGTSLAIYTPDGVHVRPGDRLAPVGEGSSVFSLPARVTFERHLVVHRGVAQGGEPVTVVQRDAPFRLSVADWAIGSAALGLAGFGLLVGRSRRRWGAVWLAVCLLLPSVAAWQDLEARRATRHIPGAWVLLAGLHAEAGPLRHGVQAGDSGWTHRLGVHSGTGEAGWGQLLARHGPLTLRLDWRPASAGLGVWVVLLGGLAAWMSRPGGVPSSRRSVEEAQG